MLEGLCRQSDPEAWFPERSDKATLAKRICRQCDVQERCLEYALANNERFGIWGGMSETERKRMRRANRVALHDAS